MNSGEQRTEDRQQRTEPEASGPSSGVRPPASQQRPDTPRPPKASRRPLVLVAAVVVVTGLAAFALWYFLVREPEPRNDSERFRGEWKLTVPRQGQSENEDAVRLGVRVTGDRFQFVTAAGDGKAFRITLNEAADPKEIDLEQLDTGPLVGPPVKMQGVYAFEGNSKVRVRLSVGRQPRPKSLDDPDPTEWVLTKVKLEPAPAPKR